VTEQEARDACAQLSAEHPDRETHRWVPTQRGEEWVVAKIGLPPAADSSSAEIRADERPPTPDAPPSADALKNWMYGGFG
jgi:hypothetical protein